MNVWLLNPYGPIPGESWRPYRFDLMARALAQRGCRVTWWTAAFSHHFKVRRANGWMDVHVQPNYAIRLVPTSSYTRHVGPGRVRFEIAFARAVFARGLREVRPDVIVGIEPPQAVGSVSARLAHRHASALVLDVMDLWPELFILPFPTAVRPLVRLASMPVGN